MTLPRGAYFSAAPAPSGTPGVPPPTWYMPQYTRATLAQKKALVVRNQRALRKLRQGFRYRCLAHEHAPRMCCGGDIELVVMLQSQVQEGACDYSGSMQSCLDGIKLLGDSVRGSGIGNASASARVQSDCRRTAWSLVDRLDAVSARAAARRLQSILDDMLSTRKAMEDEKISTQRMMCESLDAGKWRGQMVDYYSHLPSARDRYSGVIRCYTTSNRGQFWDYSQAMDQVVAECRQPYHPNPAFLSIQTDRSYPWFEPGTLAYQRTAWERCRALNGLLVTILALHAYKQEHGTYPTSLSSLAPMYIDHLPLDPFSITGTFRYQLVGNNYVLYSLGPDCIDDHGKPLNASGGDIVARTPKNLRYVDVERQFYTGSGFL